MTDPAPPGPLRRLRDSYGDDPALQLAVSTIPVLGPIVDRFLSGNLRALLEERIIRFLGDLRVEVEAILRMRGIHEQVIQSQSYAQLLLMAFEATARTRSDEKRRLYARFLARAAALDAPTIDEKSEEVLQSLAELSMTEVQVLQAIWGVSRGEEEELDPDSIIVPGLSRLEVRAYCSRLQRTGFILLETQTGMTDASFEYISVPTDLVVVPTPLLSELMRLISE